MFSSLPSLDPHSLLVRAAQSSVFRIPVSCEITYPIVRFSIRTRSSGSRFTQKLGALFATCIALLARARVVSIWRCSALRSAIVCDSYKLVYNVCDLLIIAIV